MIRALADAILATLDSNPVLAAAGIDWYAVARADLARIAARYGSTLHTAAGVTAALSPLTQWSVNLAYTESMLTAVAAGSTEAPACGTFANRDKAWRIANGGSPESILRGPKVVAFYANLLGDPAFVTIDRWAVRAAGIPLADRTNVPRKLHAELVAAYRLAAEDRGMRPLDLQAACWSVVRGAVD